jgi:hypothetical protein
MSCLSFFVVSFSLMVERLDTNYFHPLEQAVRYYHTKSHKVRLSTATADHQPHLEYYTHRGS